MSSPVVVLAKVALPAEPKTTLQVTDVLSDPKERTYFGALAHHYSALLQDTESDVRLIAELDKVIYLVDADVVRNMVERRYRDNRLRREAANLFENPTFEYALPLGAFQEIIEWLRSFSPERIPFTEPKAPRTGLNRSELIRELAHGCNVVWDESDDDEEIVRRVLNTIGENNAIVDRLLAFFSNPQFRGVISNYDLGEAARCYRVIRSRADSGERVGQDFRDAVNLSIVLKSVRARRNKPRETSSELPCYVLITQTRALLNLVDASRDDDECSSEFSALHGITGPVTENIYPVLSPRRAFIVEEVRNRYGFDNRTFANIRSERHIYDEIGDILRSRQQEQNLSVSSNAEIVTKFERHLQHLVRVYYGQDAFFRQLERERATEESLRYLEARHRVKRGDVLPAADLEARSVSFFRALRQLHLLANDIAPTSYVLRESSDEEHPDLLDFQVHSEHPAELVLEGEVYLDDGKARAYSFRWPTSCSERQFFDGLASVLEPGAAVPKRAKHSLRLRPLDGVGEEWLEGLIVSTSEGMFGTPLRGVSLRWLWKALTIEAIQAAISRELKVGEVSTKDPRYNAEDDNSSPSHLRGGETASETGPPLKISAIRITTTFAHFQFDVLPSDHDDRYVSVISHMDISEQVSHLCECTSLFAVFPIKLDHTLSQVTRRVNLGAVGRRRAINSL